MPCAHSWLRRIRSSAWIGAALLTLTLAGSTQAQAEADLGATAVSADDRGTASAEDEQTARALFEKAMQRLSGPTATQAVAELVVVADRFPQTSLAPEALFAAAQQYEESLAAPDKALGLYRRVVTSYPDSRLLRRAQSRVDQLSVSLQSGAAPLNQFQQILRSTTTDSVERSKRLDDLLRQHPGFALADEALYLLLDGALRRGDPTAPERLKQLTDRFPHSQWTARGRQAFGESLLRRGQLGRARTMFLSLAENPEPLWQKAATEGLRAVSVAEQRRLLATIGGLTLIGALLSLLIRHRQRIWPPPIEILYYFPVGLFFVLVAALLQNGVFVRPLAVLVVGGGALVWLSAAAARAGKAQSLLLGLLWRAGLAALLCYLAIERQGLWELVLETLRNGPEG